MRVVAKQLATEMETLMIAAPIYLRLLGALGPLFMSVDVRQA